MNKKSISQAVILGFIVVIIAAVLLISWLQTWKVTNQANVHKQECKNSVRLSSLTQIKQYQFRPGEIECPILKKTVIGDADQKIQAEAMKFQIAQMMAETWDVFGEGKLNLFESSGVYCSVYAIIDFDKKGKELNGLGDYLANTPVPFRNMNYISYLTNDQSSSSVYLSALKGSAIDTSKKYAVVFVYTRQLNTIDNLVNKIGGGSNVAGTISAGTISGIGVGAALLIAGGGITVITLGAGAAFVTAASIAVFGGEGPQWFASVLFTPYDSPDSLKNLGCEQFPIALETR